MAIVTSPLADTSAWGKITFYYKHNLSGLVASSENSDHVVANILDRFENNYWIAAASSGLTDITFDAGSGNTYTADYVAVNGHNFRNVGSDLSLQYSNTLDLSVPGNAGSLAYGMPGSYPTYDYRPIIGEFTSVSARWWRLRMTQAIVSGDRTPKITNAWWGEKTELDYAYASYDPTESEYIETKNISQTGRLLGIHRKYRRRALRFAISDADSDLHDKAEAWFNAVGLEPFFVSWNYTENPDTGYYMRNNSGRFSAPYRIGNGDYRNISFDLIGADHSRVIVSGTVITS